ncbi:MAG: alkyl hydroperoxide reductase [Chloroflexi bacterium]|nr:alkyl hydroperoxide reductase [Chloroflexota bacterium]
MHVIPQLRKLEQKYRQEMVVIGVHSAKFTSEKQTENIRKAVLRYGIEHPVVNDRESLVWRQYAARAWPTLMFIDPVGKVIGKHEGEIAYEPFDQLIGEMVREFDGQGLIDRRPLEFRHEAEGGMPLLFPGKALADGPSGRLFIADSGHHRILVVSGAGAVQQVIGAGEPGLVDGDARSARFNAPQGLALDGASLYVADTENHAVRRVDLEKRRVETIAGVGQQAQAYGAGGPARTVALSSPWDLALRKGALYIAMAGVHQLWALDVVGQTAHPYAGSGREGLLDAGLSQAWLAQPSGIATDGERLYFADSETSAIRAADLDGGGIVCTIVGRDLFEYGDVDGEGDAVRLQHPLGLCWYDGQLYVADTYNNKIKRVDPRSREAVTLAGTGNPGHRDGLGLQAQFHEPGGVSAAGGKLYVADTNNHAIRVVDITSGEVATLELKGSV